MLSSRDDWFLKPGPQWEVAVSSRVRFARNLDGRRFPNHSGAQEQREAVEALEMAFASLPGENLQVVPLKEVGPLDRQFLVERRLISVELAAGLGERGAVFNPSEGVGALLNEEDHLRLQVFKSGLNLQEALRRIRSLEEPLAGILSFAKDPVLGYLTACPTNLGWGLRASVMLHLPALVYTNQILKVLEGVNQVGLVVRGLQGESTRVQSAFFQVSNQSSLGKRPAEIVEHVERVARQLIEVEWQARKTVFSQEGMAAQDRICRTLGVLKSAKLMVLEEALDSLSALRVGVEGRIIRDLSLADLNRFLLAVQPAHLAKAAGQELGPEDQLVHRATYLRQALRQTEPA